MMKEFRIQGQQVLDSDGQTIGSVTGTGACGSLVLDIHGKRWECDEPDDEGWTIAERDRE